MTKKNANIAGAAKAKWEAPQLVTVDANLADIEASLNPGTDSLMVGLSSQS
ncbi:hypothetical protein [Erythrobacter sp. THAF29]|uniref:hypothetical protein n=1 Tax=Erythrobacter sp. THAF29 TaxID=2587851 RepID=UPI0012AA55FF|nr:hypothetical protein [Erythrobacter sp. THAF29]QFT78477.1 hypothetical protein FIU90_13075 [Erythrobacter sp. THAF29]